MTSEASLSALEAFCSPSAAITLALASLAASASAAMALCSCTGNLASLLKRVNAKRYILPLQGMHREGREMDIG
jgi:hypothetical protein